MIPFIAIPDSLNGGVTWWQNPNDSINYAASNYIYTMYNFNNPADSGTWCNSDNSSYFSSYTQTSLGISTADTASYNREVFLVFSSVNSMVHCYQTSSTNYDYSYAPIGLTCTIVAIEVKYGKIYSSFTPVTISAGLTVNFPMTETTDVAFKAQLNALN